VCRTVRRPTGDDSHSDISLTARSIARADILLRLDFHALFTLLVLAVITLGIVRRNVTRVPFRRALAAGRTERETHAREFHIDADIARPAMDYGSRPVVIPQEVIRGIMWTIAHAGRCVRRSHREAFLTEEWTPVYISTGVHVNRRSD
jgi:hypothetical protein